MVLNIWYKTCTLVVVAPLTASLAVGGAWPALRCGRLHFDIWESDAIGGRRNCAAGNLHGAIPWVEFTKYLFGHFRRLASSRWK